MARTVTVIRELAQGRPPTPEVLGVDAGTGLVALEYLPGRVLDDTLGRERAGRTKLAGAGAALALLHDRHLSALPARTADHDAAAALAAAEHIAVLLPDLAGTVRGLAGGIVRGMADLPLMRTTIHGDFSADQVVIAPDGRVALVDLDSGAIGDPASDLACAAAALASRTVLGGDPSVETLRVRALFEGYSALRPLPAPETLALHVAAMLLRRAVDPFRLCAPSWPPAVTALVGRAENALAGASAPAGLT